MRCNLFGPEKIRIAHASNPGEVGGDPCLNDCSSYQGIKKGRRQGGASIIAQGHNPSNRLSRPHVTSWKWGKRSLSEGGKRKLTSLEALWPLTVSHTMYTSNTSHLKRLRGSLTHPPHPLGGYPNWPFQHRASSLRPRDLLTCILHYPSRCQRFTSAFLTLAELHNPPMVALPITSLLPQSTHGAGLVRVVIQPCADYNLYLICHHSWPQLCSAKGVRGLESICHDVLRPAWFDRLPNILGPFGHCSLAVSWNSPC